MLVSAAGRTRRFPRGRANARCRRIWPVAERPGRGRLTEPI